MEKKIRVGVAGYGTIGQRLADGVALQKDMELVGVADLAPTLAIRALKEKGMPYALYLVEGADKSKFDALNIPVSGTFDELIHSVDIMLDSSPGGIGIKNKALYEQAGIKAVFQGGEKNSIADVFFHGYANYELGLNKDYLKLTSCNTTGLIRSVDCLDRAFGVDRVAITIIRRVADPGDYHRGLTNALQIDKAPSHQALDLMTIMPHVQATGILVHTPVTHGHIITVLAHGKQKITKEMALDRLNSTRASAWYPSTKGSSATRACLSMRATLATRAGICMRSGSGRIPSWSRATTSCTPSTFRRRA